MGADKLVFAFAVIEITAEHNGKKDDLRPGAVKTSGHCIGNGKQRRYRDITVEKAGNQNIVVVAVNKIGK